MQEPINSMLPRILNQIIYLKGYELIRVYSQHSLNNPLAEYVPSHNPLSGKMSRVRVVVAFRFDRIYGSTSLIGCRDSGKHEAGT